MINAILKEITLRKDYLGEEKIETIYFGGGTPSLLDAADIDSICARLTETFLIATDPEITLEANPDDLNIQKLTDLKHAGINRLSIGVQSFFNEDLDWMNRAHNAKEARTCIDNALALGFHDLSIDLIFGSPSTSHKMWEENLRIADSYDIPHLSCYALTVEPKTALHDMIKKRKTDAPLDQQIQEQFYLTDDILSTCGYEHYEISNYAKDNRYATHNTAYWKAKNYLGLGPSAHSYNGVSRSWNVANNMKYINALTEGQLTTETEQLSPTDLFNEYLMTGLRTIWGCTKEKLNALLPEGETGFWDNLEHAVKDGQILNQEGRYTLSKELMVIADNIIAALFIVE